MKLCCWGRPRPLWLAADLFRSRLAYGEWAARVRVHLDAELGIPFIAVWILVYRSIDIMFLMSPFILRTRPEIRGLTLTLSSSPPSPARFPAAAGRARLSARGHGVLGADLLPGISASS